VVLHPVRCQRQKKGEEEVIVKNIKLFAVTINSIDVDGNGKPRSVTLQPDYSLSLYDYVANESVELQYLLSIPYLSVVSLSQPPNAPNGGAVTNLKYTIPFALFISNGSFTHIELAELPAGSVILAAKAKVSATFDGGAISFDVGVGTAGGTPGGSFTTMIVDQCAANAGTVEIMQISNVYIGDSPRDFGVTLSGGGPLTGLTAGSVDVWVSYLVQS
jgi:hypothetical protein